MPTTTKASAAKTQEQIEETADAIKQQAKEKLEAGAESIQQATKSAENVVKDHPLLSLGCAFLAGWAVSKLIK
ncbi:hypothetical protein [Vibrio rhizosphaerae]|uniref:DUF883 domain-containing protein n=1 Tax=Vibrio rhizosphaerae TaxID=398736 RepID=A0ABU4IW73_9VIBR|nr:hypothetical protein [Vibrio rhizosphaerae]MDW6092539.1 hypothetical protein [Vibrio rhizosphaerae]